MISCTDQLSPTGGSFELRFSRCSPLLAPANPNTLAPPAPITSIQPHLRSNPHEEAEPYLRQILRHGPLALSLHRLVGLLRDTLPIAVELDRLSASSREERVSLGHGWPKQVRSTEEPWFDTVVKGMGWWRVLYGDLRYASLPPSSCFSNPSTFVYSRLRSLTFFFFQTRARLESNDRQTHRHLGCLVFAFSRQRRVVFTAKCRLWSRLFLTYTRECGTGEDRARAHSRFSCTGPRRRPRDTPTHVRKRLRRATDRPDRRGRCMRKRYDRTRDTSAARAGVEETQRSWWVIRVHLMSMGWCDDIG